MLTPEQLEILRRLDGCTVANTIEIFQKRLRNEGYADSTIRCIFPEMPPMLGYAATIKIGGSAPAFAGPNYVASTEWWDYVQSLPSPRVAVVQDVSEQPSKGSLIGAVHVNILHALNCAGVVTNGAVRNMPTAEKLGLQLFAGGVSVSHAYVHIIEFGKQVEVGGLRINSGDLLHGDMHGVQTIPLDIASEIPRAAAQIIAQDQELINLCQSKDFSLEKLRAAIAKSNR
jgi:4-hydroxy-4-methyl-2-oxoglutarate aldolase